MKKDDDFPFNSTKEYHENCDFISKYWMDLHTRKWGRQILNSDEYKEDVIKNTTLEDKDKYLKDDEYKIEPWLSSEASELLKTYFTLRIESVVKKAYLHCVCDKRRTLMKKDVIKAIISVDLDKTSKDSMYGEIQLEEGEKVKYED